MPMSYERHLDEVATLLYERYEQSEEAAIGLVMAAQEDGFFSGHDDDPSICTLERAQEDARAVFQQYGHPLASTGAQRQRKQGATGKRKR
ncbi:hypothetical protein C666_06310 [Thauera linaloolentis 47Lol = DSM 12138]|uniref:Uncharacterized protein n=1 Tax=Thauera linaloolentis (strain DSM 12138 / JCM 21573 / CCUG 41526 / CIP 105981 / IAM 15112 / NBRC 102519 / 47Lol) TaxID=1123367 RepID=N6Z4R2_THAL4|nr:hypothetical protein [Thauera linaloolentis]ENO89388.1 hypothetical protein C666_06310 [Thauera linaloolentis 47Lol = DSM 12138]MCM8564388.1 hypothetical protein [Thauera linaloolentis]